ncbi:DgaE family pyridoxal phosphate-dependent ammonia lyase [Lactococcus petauri]|uniref:DgaE family pyridoxal phosphate-dependent ammonia lyase n=1 Tax=Lactococcus petauri TaxID=1940789 RepID=UPI001F57FAAB|nr:DgaE family pyridoxal phosphate-dependent ammonia lyase [Lactococcus petauri]
MNSYEKFELKRVINASGKMTILGVSKVSDTVAQAQKEAGQSFFEMQALVEKSGQYIAKLLSVENATVVSSASSGIALSIAAIIGQGQEYNIYNPYSSKIQKREIVMPKGHNVNYGTGVEVMIQVGGGKLVEAGWANECSQTQVEMEITENTAALLYIKSHHTVQKSMLSIKEMQEVALKYNLPLIVDAAAEEDLQTYYQQGADLVIYSGAKAIEAPTSAMVIGRNPYIPWIQMQNKGIGRAMKIGKENIVGLVAALELYLANGNESKESMLQRLRPFVDKINEIKGLETSIVQDAAGREIYRARVKVTSDQTTAVEVIQKLKQGRLAIYTREYQANNGIIEFDIRAVNQEEMLDIECKLKEIMEGTV